MPAVSARSHRPPPPAGLSALTYPPCSRHAATHTPSLPVARGGQSRHYRTDLEQSCASAPVYWGLDPGEEYQASEQQRAETAVSAVTEVWRADETGATMSMARQMLAALEKMATRAVDSVEDCRQQSQYYEGMAEAMDVAKAMLQPNGQQPGWEQWRKVRAVVSGALPMPSAAEQAATRVRRLGGWRLGRRRRAPTALTKNA